MLQLPGIYRGPARLKIGLMFERMTDQARRVVVLAQEEARFLNHPYIGTEHMLLGFMREGEGVGYQALVRHGISLETAREQVRKFIGEGVEAPGGHISFTPRAKKIFKLSLREALQLGHNYIGSEHVLLGLVREGGGVGAQVLARLGLELALLRETVLDLIKDHPEHRVATQRPWPSIGRLPPCLHQPESLRYRPIEIAGEDDQPSMTAVLVSCSSCRATIGVLPALALFFGVSASPLTFFGASPTKTVGQAPKKL